MALTGGDCVLGRPEAVLGRPAETRAFLGYRRGNRGPGCEEKAGARAGELKMVWTEPPGEARAMGIEWSAEV